VSGHSNLTDTSMWNATDAVRFTDSAGVRWRVVDRAAPAPDVAPNGLIAHCLIFLSESIVRRVWIFPKEWRRLSPAALEALTDRLQPAQPGPPRA
jgi:uncharacterized protein YjeT (DUF2065 family)